MPRFIILLVDREDSGGILNKEYIMEWSTVVDAPVTNGMSREQFVNYYKEEYGEEGMRNLPDRMERVELKGTSSRIDDSAESVISCNRAGPHEVPLSYEEIVRFYCRGEDAVEDHPCWLARYKDHHAMVEKGGYTKEEFNAYIARWKDAHLKPCDKKGKTPSEFSGTDPAAKARMEGAAISVVKQAFEGKRITVADKPTQE